MKRDLKIEKIFFYRFLIVSGFCYLRVFVFFLLVFLTLRFYFIGFLVVEEVGRIWFFLTEKIEFKVFFCGVVVVLFLGWCFFGFSF